MDLNFLKTYIETSLSTNFIQLSQFFAGLLILFDKKFKEKF